MTGKDDAVVGEGLLSTTSLGDAALRVDIGDQDIDVVVDIHATDGTTNPGNEVDSVALYALNTSNVTIPLKCDDQGHLMIDVTVADEVTVKQSVHDDLNCNSNLQVGDVDVTDLNPVPVKQTQSPVGYDNVADLWKHRLVEEVLPSTGTTQIITMTGSALSGASFSVGKHVSVAARTGNSAPVYFTINGVAVTGATDGVELQPGESLLLRIDDTNMISVIGTAGDVVEIVGA